LVGKVEIDQACGVYNDIWTKFIALCFKESVETVYRKAMATPKVAEFAQLVLLGESGKQRFLELSRLDKGVIVSANFPNVIQESPSQIARWAKESIAAIAKLPSNTGDLRPNLLSKNPLIVWGAAVFDGIIQQDEVPAAANFISSKFGRLSEHPNLGTFTLQAGAIKDAHEFWCSADVAARDRFQELCIAAGVVLDANFLLSRYRK